VQYETNIMLAKIKIYTNLLQKAEHRWYFWQWPRA